MDFRLLDGKPKATIIERFNGEVYLITPSKTKIEDFTNIKSAMEYAYRMGWEINVSHLFGTVESWKRRGHETR